MAYAEAFTLRWVLPPPLTARVLSDLVYFSLHPLTFRSMKLPELGQEDVSVF